MNHAQVVLKDVAHYPHLVKVGNGEQARAVIQASYPFEPSDVLLNDRSRNRRAEFDRRSRVCWVASHQTHSLFCIAHISSSLLFGVRRELQVFFCKGTMRVQQLSSV